ncbi:MAG TPA: response regulator transcription factor [Candidatus Krumholzibacteria bacterium]|nr:response regulator transcription factor [Candidatus Krumholzibacteria bacterium]HPD70746.1 response regulator transcription factor [Candidatus Krumholzibacteria bacterium]HRY39554.1 response regulator transcription factor [Candidatus Krumholzibacteria bacterium]
MDAYRILIVDDHPLVRSGICAMLELDKDLAVCGEAEDVPSAMAAIQTLDPDLALVDISLKGGASGLELLKTIRQKHPDLKTLAVSMHDEESYALRALKAGAQGYVMKQEGTEKIREAIRCVLEGRTYLSQTMTQTAVDHLGSGGVPRDTTPSSVLSDRELELFELTGQGREIAEIARIMNISPRTVEVHRSHIKKKLGLKTSTEIFQCSYEWLRERGMKP